jgi:adhesin transport system outer membrane protein
MVKRYLMSRTATGVFLGLGCLSALSASASVGTFAEALSAALEYNPAVTQSYFDFEAARQAEAVAAGAMLPSVDLTADYGREERETPLLNYGRYDREGVRFQITQLLFDGFQTRDVVRSRHYEQLSSFYDFEQATQKIALEATNAYLDTVVYQRLVEFAEQNYVVHRQVFNRLVERNRGGRSNGVDVEQATARLALAESNLLTEVTNLHDIQLEFQRVVGQAPSAALAMPTLPRESIPSLRAAVLEKAYQQSPAVNSAIEDMRAARMAVSATRGDFFPRVDLRYRNEWEKNIGGVRGDFDLEAIELVMTYNFYSGGSDVARRREANARYYSAIEARKQACLNTRRDTVIAFNDISALSRQVSLLEEQLRSQDRARAGYSDQFELGQRSLLDLLDSQNEYFDTQRALVQARAALISAQATTLAEMGMLTQTLGVDGFSADRIDVLGLDLVRSQDEGIPLCPQGAPGEIEINQEAIFERLDARAETLPGSAP